MGARSAVTERSHVPAPRISVALSDRAPSNCQIHRVDYRCRIVDDSLDALVPHPAAFALEGAKEVGRISTATQRPHDRSHVW